MNNLGVIGALSSCATLLLFVFYFTGRVASIINNRGLIYEKIDVYYNRDSIPSGLKIVDGYELNQGEYLIITSNKGLKYIKIFEYIYDEKKCKYHKGKLFYEYYGLNIGQAIEINTYLPCGMPYQILEYQRYDYIKGYMPLGENGKNGVLEDNVKVRHSIKSILYYLVK